MTLLAEIQAAFPSLTAANRDDGAIAAALSVGRTKVVTTLGGIGTVLEALGPTDGAALLDQLETLSATNSALKWAFVLINRGELDFGSVATRSMIDLLIPDPAKTALKAIAQVPDTVSVQDVSKALEGVL